MGTSSARLDDLAPSSAIKLLISVSLLAVIISPRLALAQEDRKPAIASLPRMVKITGGDFVFGTADPIREPFMSEELPEQQTKVVDFLLAANEVSKWQWDECVSAGVCATLPETGLGDERLPARGMTWIQAQQYVDWLNTSHGTKRFRLPTEREWEYAAKSGHTQEYWRGRVPSPEEELVAFKTKPGESKYLKAPVRLRKGGSRQENAFGLYDMLGSVMEWTSGHWAKAKDARESREMSLTEPTADERSVCVARGGHHSMSDTFARPTMRFLFRCGDRMPSLGIRLAATEEPSSPDKLEISQ